MIPTILIPGLVIGRWWFVPLAAVLWSTVLVISGVEGSTVGLVVAGGLLAAANAAVGIAVNRSIRWVIRHVRTGRPAPTPV